MEVVVVVLGALDLDSLLDVDGVLGKRTEAKGLDGGLVDTDGLLDRRTDAGRLDKGLVDADGLLDHLRTVVVVVMVAVDNSLGHADVFLDRSGTVATVVRANDGLVDTNGLLDRSGTLVMVVVVMVRAVDDSLSYVDLLAVAWLVTSTIFTLDLVDGAQVLLRKRLVVVVGMVTVVVTVDVELNMSVRVRGTSGSVRNAKKAIESQRSSLISH